MKNRAGWLALLVLAIATLLMVFFVIPRISETEQEASTPPVPAIETTIADAGADALEKMGRLAKTAEDSVGGLSALFSEGKTPAADVFAAARETAESAVSALAALEVPEAVDAAIKDQLNTVRGYAEKTLALIKALPADPQQAAAAIDAIAATLKGEEVPAPAAQAPADASAATETASPKFDVLRVEPDGSTVIAGNAAPGATIDVLNGDKVIASVVAGESGDFAAVLDTPLPPGDHALALRSTDAEGKAVVSDEVASVSVPSTADGKLLALVTKPGEPSRIVTMPETVNEGSKQPRLPAEETALTLPELPAASSELTSAPPISAEAPAAAATTPAATSGGVTVQVTAVEIENDRLFIAGTASTGGTVRAYADEQPVGEAAIDGAGHFVVEAQHPLSVGDHTVRVELLDETGKVVVAASVPFSRPEGTQVAAVAPSASASDATMVPLERGAFDKQRDTLGKAFGILQSLFANGGQPAMEDVSAARSATEIALQSLVEFQLPADASAAITDAVTKTAGAAKAAFDTLHALPQSVDAVRDALPKIAGLVDAVLKAAPAAPPEASPVAQQPSGTPAQAETAVAAAPTISQAPLEASDNSVIIRQGDTLWQIARRVYGQGVRYTTIYLANEGQISNPDLIEPGQIFKVPSEALPNSEELHWKHMHGQPME
ncbi:LysM peptidoglycan-binding domain-containing protein [Pseudomonas sp. R2.Fl]|nr:LysM peptidoglycan-binding domain-containing protein [Pseudomonas sp. R2.Fl]